MAVPGSTGPTRQEAANEGRLRVARRETPPGGAQPGPNMSDQAAQQARQMRTERASDQAAAQNVERRQGITQKAGVQIDRKRIEYTPETQVGDLTISRGHQVTQREEMGAGAGRGGAVRQQSLENQLNRVRRDGQESKPEKEPKGAPTPSIRDAKMLAKATPAGAVAGAAMGVASGKLSTADIQRGIGRGCILMLWNSLWLTFGHTIYAIAILLYVASTSKYARKYFPEVGEEWFPADMIKKMPKVALIPIKMAEIVGIAFIFFWVFMLDMACIGLLALLLGVIISAANFF